MKKYIVSGFLVVTLILPMVTKAQDTTSEDLLTSLQQQIAQLLEQITNLQAEISSLRGQVKKAETQIETLTKHLQQGIKDDEVESLQEFLAQYSDIYPEGLVTGYFGPLTRGAVLKFQEKHGIETVGVVGPKTRAKINQLMAGENKITICHYPSGNADARHTIVINESAWPAHLAHGDTLGPCPEEPIPTPTPCSESWSCGSWSACVNNTQTRTCTDANSCGSTNLRPALSQSCSPNPIPIPTPTPCTELWSCGSWSSCENDTQTRTCTDANNCSTTDVRPALSQSCTSEPTPEPVPSAECTDSDGGRNYYVKGTTTGLNVYNQMSTITDRCGAVNIGYPQDERYVHEYSCEGASAVDEDFLCPNGCQDGACIYPDTSPPSNVIKFTAVGGDSQIGLSWVNIPEYDFAGTKILRKTGIYPASVTDGTLIYNGTGASYTDTGLTNGTAYYYKAFTYDEALNYSSGVGVTAIPLAPQDTTPPVISNIQVSNITQTSATITWQTDEASDSVVNYGLTTSYGLTISGGAGTTYHEVNLTNLTVGTTYHYKVNSTDNAGNQTQSGDRIFTTITSTSLTCAGGEGKFCSSKTPTEMCSGIWFDENGCCLGDCYVPEDNHCYDSDGGENYYVKGYVETEATKFVKIDNSLGVLYDTCYGDMLREYRCEEDYLPYAHITEIYGRTVDVDSTYICPNGCQDGACVDVTAFENLLKDIQSQVAVVSTAVSELFSR